MKYPCEIIQDLLPLYIDEVCSEESKKVIEEHLQECPKCKAMYIKMKDSDEVEISPIFIDRELQKAESYHSVKKKIFRKQLFIAVGAVCAIIILSLSLIGILRNTEQVIKYNDNIYVSMVDGDLVGRLSGSQVSYLREKRISIIDGDEEKDILFFYISDTKWDEIISSENIFSEFLLCEADKGADDINAVYYFIGDYSNLDSMSEIEFENIILSSQLLWEK